MYPLFIVWYSEKCENEQEFGTLPEALAFYESLATEDKCIMEHANSYSSPREILASGYYTFEDTMERQLGDELEKLNAEGFSSMSEKLAKTNLKPLLLIVFLFLGGCKMPSETEASRSPDKPTEHLEGCVDYNRNMTIIFQTVSSQLVKDGNGLTLGKYIGEVDGEIYFEYFSTHISAVNKTTGAIHVSDGIAIYDSDVCLNPMGEMPTKLVGPGWMHMNFKVANGWNRWMDLQYDIRDPSVQYGYWTKAQDGTCNRCDRPASVYMQGYSAGDALQVSYALPLTVQ